MRVQNFNRKMDFLSDAVIIERNDNTKTASTAENAANVQAKMFFKIHVSHKNGNKTLLLAAQTKLKTFFDLEDEVNACPDLKNRADLFFYYCGNFSLNTTNENRKRK